MKEENKKTCNCVDCDCENDPVIKSEEKIVKESWEEKLRQDFQDFADSIVWSNDEGDEKYIGVGNMADWWIDKAKEIEKEAYQRAVFDCKKIVTRRLVEASQSKIMFALNDELSELQALKGEEIK